MFWGKPRTRSLSLQIVPHLTVRDANIHSNGPIAPSFVLACFLELLHSSSWFPQELSWLAWYSQRWFSHFITLNQVFVFGLAAYFRSFFYTPSHLLLERCNIVLLTFCPIKERIISGHVDERLATRTRLLAREGGEKLAHFVLTSHGNDNLLLFLVLRDCLPPGMPSCAFIILHDCCEFALSCPVARCLGWFWT